MARQGAELAIARGEVHEIPSVPSPAESAVRELEAEITNHQNQPIPALLQEVVERVRSLTRADGAAVALRDQWGVVCRASTGDAPELGARLQPDSALTRECFESGQVVVCEDAETDERVHRSTAKNLRLRSAVVVPLEAQGSVVGVLEILSSRPFAFDIEHVARLQRIGELLSDVLIPLPAQPEEEVEELGQSLSASAPAQVDELLFPLKGPVEPEEVEELEKSVPTPAPAPPEEPQSRAPLVAGAVVLLLLLLLLLLLWFAVLRPKPVRAPSPPANPPDSTPARPAQPPLVPKTTQEERAEARRPPPPAVALPDNSLHPGPSAAAMSSSPSTAPPAARSTAVSSPKPATAESRAAKSVGSAVPALVIQGAPPGAQIFVDDQFVNSINSAGQASISTLPAGQHRVHLRLDGYRDYDQGVNLQANQTSTITAKLEPFEPPALGASAIAPVVAVPAVLPAPVTSTRGAMPDFVLERTLKGHSGWVTSVAFSPDGQRLASGSWDQTVKFWEVSTGEQLSTVARKMKEIQALAFSRDGRWLATENSSNSVTLRDATTGQEIRTLSSDKPLGALGSNWVYSIAFSPDGQWLASGVDDKTVRLWDVQTGRKVRDLAALRRSVIYIAFSPDGRFLATGDDEKVIRIWDVSNGKEIQKMSGHKKPIYAVAFSPNGRWLASASGDKSVKLWDVVSGREVHTLTGHGNVVTSLAFSPDGRWLVSGSWDKTIRIWEVETGKEVQTLAGHDHPVYSVAFGSQGRWLASGSEDGTIKLWRLTEAADQSRLRR